MPPQERNPKHPPSTTVAGHFAYKTKALQNGRKLRAERMPGQVQDVFGGYVSSYAFDPNPKSNIAQGTMWIDFSSQTHVEVEVTVVTIGGEQKDSDIAHKLVLETAKLAELSDMVVDVYFCTHVEGINQYVVVYERFTAPFFGEAGKQIAGPFFLDGESVGGLPPRKFQLSPFWLDRMRSFIDLLEYGKMRGITHGGLSDMNSYVICSGTMKVINVGRHYGGTYIPEKDVTDFRTLIMTNAYFNGASSKEWCTLDKLLGSKMVTRFWDGWKRAVLGHPILQESDDDLIATFDGVNKSVSEIGFVKATKLANLLCAEFPFFRKVVEEMDPVYPVDRRAVLARFFPPDDYHVLKELLLFIFPGSDGRTPYRGLIIYLEVINLSRNYIHHAGDYDERMDDAKHMRSKLRDYFTHYLSAAYTLLHMLDDDPDKNKGPYKWNRRDSSYSLEDCVKEKKEARR